MYLQNFKQWVGRTEWMKGKLRLNFAAADWAVCWNYLPEIAGVIWKQKPKSLTFGAIWCIRWSWKGTSLVFSQGSVYIRVVWIIFGSLSISSGKHRPSLHWHQPVQTPLYCREHLPTQCRGWGQGQCLGTASRRSRVVCSVSAPLTLL